jgi:hypothetical protein
VRAVKQLDEGIDDTFLSSVREEVSFALIDFRTNWMEKSRASGMKTLQSIRRYGQYHRPIALPIVFWLNTGSYISPGSLRRPSDDLGSKF